MTKLKNNSGFHWNTGSIILYIIILIVILVIFKIISINANYSPMFQWWNQNNGKQYNKFFNLFGVMASYESKFLYYISNIFGSLFNTINREQILFLANRIFPLTKSSTGNDPSRFVTPRHIANNIEFSFIDGDKWFNDFLKNKKYVNPKTGEYYSYNENIPLSYTVDQGDDPDDPTKFYRNVDESTQTVGIYPSSIDREGWRMLFQEWGSGKWKIRSPDDPNFRVPEFNQDTAAQIEKNWFTNCENQHPDNFFARYGIAPDSPLVICFVNGSYQDPAQPGTKINSNSFKNLINNTNNTPGGWIGYLEGMESSSISEDDYINFIDSKYISIDPSKSPGSGNLSTCDSSTQVTNWTNAAATGGGIAGMAAFLGLTTAGIGFIIAGIALFAIQGISQQVSCNQQNSKKTSTTLNKKLKNNRFNNYSKHKIIK